MTRYLQWPLREDFPETWVTRTPPDTHVCFCVGPQDGQPLCPCKMQRVTIKDGRYVEVIDHGPARPPLQRFHPSPESKDDLDV